jgi:hypothetical protein
MTILLHIYLFSAAIIWGDALVMFSHYCTLESRDMQRENRTPLEIMEKVIVDTVIISLIPIINTLVSIAIILRTLR